MSTSSTWPKLLPPLGILLALALLGAAGAVWWNGSSTAGGSGGLGELVAVVQAARSEARAALSGKAKAFDALVASRAVVTSARSRLAADETASAAARRLGADAALWQRIDRSLDSLLASRASLDELDAARAEVLKLAPDLLAAAGNVSSVLPADELAINQPHLARFELTVQTLRQEIRAFGADADADALQRIGDAEQYLAQFIRGLRGEDATLGLVAVGGRAAPAALVAADDLLERARRAIAAVGAAAEPLTAASAAADELDAAAAELLSRYSGTDLGSTTVVGAGIAERLPLLLVVAALVITALMMFVYHRARDFRRAAEMQAEQNERNQQAILRLLDELSSLADGNLTVQATVTEDITGAIADSINYAIDALRELVTTVNDSSILVDAAAKQTEGTARHLVRAAETQAKQAAAASESTARMAISIEEVSGNAERCSDVARHSVEVAHKGGEAVRRTIAGMKHDSRDHSGHEQAHQATRRELARDRQHRRAHRGDRGTNEHPRLERVDRSVARGRKRAAGFAVVADEVQKLAERSAGATKKIEVLVSTIQSDTNEAVMSMERSTTDVVGGALLAENAGAALDEIEQVSHQIASLVQNISSSSKEQTSVAGAITKNMGVLREISAKTTESTAATSAAISKLSELASQLRRTVAGFTLPDQGGGTGVLTAERVAASLERAEKAPAQISAPVVAQGGERRRQSG